MKSNYLPWTLTRVGLNLIGLLLLGTLWYGLSHKPKATPAVVNSTPTVEGLCTDYDTFNAKFFNDKLAKNVRCIWIYDDFYRANTVYEKGVFTIGFNPKYNKAETDADMHLLHEMCHIRDWNEPYTAKDSHGPKFQSCMKDLAKWDAFQGLW